MSADSEPIRPLQVEDGYPEHPVIWFNSVDQRSFWLEVVDVGVAMAQLRIFDLRGAEPELLADEPVTLIAGAMFGPDVSDVEMWKNRGLEVIDARLADSPPS